MSRPRYGGLLWHHVWTAVFAANLIVPMWFASSMLGEAGKVGEVGMALAVALLWVLGDVAGVRSRNVRIILISGGIAVALTQFFPLLQIFAGAASLSFVGWVLGESNLVNGSAFRKAPGLGVFLATLLTGSFLLLASCFAGLLLHLLLISWQRARGRGLREERDLGSPH